MTQPATHVASFRQIAKTYRSGLRRKRTPVLTDVTLKLLPGEIFALLGPNGAGKTTLMKILLGLVKPTRGTGRVLGGAFGSRDALARIGYQPEQPYLYPALTVRETLRFMAGLSQLKGRRVGQRTDAVIALLGLEPQLGQRIRKLSRGWLQRVTLASALLPDPDLLLLDEPLGGLDPGARLETKKLITQLKRAGKTVWLNSHILPDVEALADRVALLGEGRILAQGEMESLLRRRDARVVITFASQAPPTPPDSTVIAADSGRRKQWWVDQTDSGRLQSALESLFHQGAQVLSVEPERESLESFFTRALDDPAHESAQPERRLAS